jgi:BirA family biotin operon repressor/biotin-[acetyl-CoA-carboxylase] ligase
MGDSKVGGILGEAEVEAGRIGHVVIGIGVNLAEPEDVAGAGAIGDVDQAALLTGFLQRFRPMIEDSHEEILSRWRAVSATLGRRVEAVTVGGDTASGVAVDLDETGALLIESGGGLVRVAFGEIQHLGVNQG